MLLLMLTFIAHAGQHLDTTQRITPTTTRTIKLELYTPNISLYAPKPYQNFKYTLEQPSPGRGILQMQKSCSYLKDAGHGWCTNDSLQELVIHPDGLLTKALLGHPLSVHLNDQGRFTRVEHFEPAFETLAGWGLAFPPDQRPIVAEGWQKALAMMHNLCASTSQLDAELAIGASHESTTTFTLPGRRPFDAVMVHRLNNQVDSMAWVDLRAWPAPRTSDSPMLGDGRMGVDVRDGLVHRLFLPKKSNVSCRSTSSAPQKRPPR